MWLLILIFFNFRHQFLSVFATSSDLTSKLALGTARTVVTAIQDYQVKNLKYLTLKLIAWSINQMLKYFEFLVFSI